ncbi:titin homolog isoform X2 [Octopus sinensis]|uniref:Titin homolog isoform X2 n=1 Tax=Octopus sinensis TaxID=2607531 RepID=A0A7E6FUW9_9MOLL|nr:titin homolog isoform X2 [Octopus sinensis]
MDYLKRSRPYTSQILSDVNRYKSSHEDITRYRSGHEDINRYKSSHEDITRYRSSHDDSKRYKSSHEDVNRYKSSLEDSNRYKSSLDDTNRYKSGLEDTNKYISSLDDTNRYKSSLEDTSRYKSSLDDTSRYKSNLEDTSRYKSSLNDTSRYKSSLEDTSRYKSSLDDTSRYLSSLDDTSRYKSSLDDTSRYLSSLDDTSRYKSSLDDTSRYLSSLDDTNRYKSSLEDTTRYKSSVEDTTRYKSSHEDISRYKSSNEIASSRRSKVSYSDNVSSMYLTDLDLTDAGSYSSKATNKYGTTHTSSSFDIQGVRHRRKKKEDLETETRFITYDGTQVDPLSPPVILLPLVDEYRNIGESVTFSITVRSQSDVEVTWSHNEDIIQPSSKYSISKEHDVYYLSISDLNPNDAGCWRCLAINYYGQAQTACELTVYNYTLERYRAPKFLQGLHNIVVSEGASVKFRCKISAHPEGKIIWFKNRQPIKDDNVYKISEESSEIFSLFINEVIREDIGFYMCQAINQAGSSSSEAKLSVETQEKPLSLLERNPLSKEHSQPPEDDEEEQPKYTCMPEFTTKLKNKLAQVDNPIRLSCSVSGVPDPTIQWYKNGEKIHNGLTYVIKNSSGLLTLDIPCVSSKDEGQYVCEASNSHGTVSCSSTISLQGSNRSLSKISDYETPVFLDTPLCCTAACGEDAMFNCVATGHPSPSFKWSKDGINVEDNRRCQVFVDNHGGCRLIIHKVEENDSGLYSCTAHNSAGRTTCSTRLRIVGVSATHSRQTSQERSYSLQKFEKAPDLDVADRMLTPGQPPYFTMMLAKKIELNEGEKLRLDCSIEGIPSPVITWQKGVRQLTYDARHRIIAYGTLQTLEIPAVMITDRGEYIVRAANVFGIIETSCSVTVNKKSKKGYDRQYNKMKGSVSRRSASTEEDTTKLQAPFFVKHLPHTIDVIEGTDVRLDCVVKTQKPVPQIEVTSDRQTIEGGVKSASQTVEPAEKMTPSHVSDYKVTTSAAAAPCSGEEREIDPSFTQKFDDIVVTEGDDAVLECKTSGESDVRWLKDGEALSSSDHITIVCKGGLHQLHIHKCTGDDEAIYTCISSAGGKSASCMAMLSTKRNRESLFDSSYGEDLFKRWEIRLYGESYSRPERHSPQRSPERERRYRSSSQESDRHSRYSRYSESPYNRYPSYGGGSKERYSRYDRFRRSESYDLSQRSESHDQYRRSESFDLGSDYDARYDDNFRRNLRRRTSDSDYSIDTDDETKPWSMRGRHHEKREEKYSKETTDPTSPRPYDELDSTSRTTRETLEQKLQVKETKRISDKSIESVEEKYSALTKSLFADSAGSKETTTDRTEYISSSKEYKTDSIGMEEDKKLEFQDVSYDSSHQKYKLSYETESSDVFVDTEVPTKKVTETPEKVTDVPTEVPEKAADIPVEVPEKVVDVPADVPEKIVDISVEVPEKVADIPIEVPEKVADIPVEVPEKIVDISVEVPEKVADIPTEVPEKVADIPVEVPEKIVDISVEVPEKIVDIPTEIPEKVADVPTEEPEKIVDISFEIPEAVAEIPVEVPEKAADIPVEVFEKVADVPTEEPEKVADVPTEKAAEITVEEPEKAVDISFEIPETVADIPTELPEKVTDVPAEVPEKAPEVSTDVAEKTADAPTNIAETITDVHVEVREEISEVSTDVAEKTADAPTDIAETITDVHFEVSEEISEVSTDVAEKVHDTPSDMHETVSEVITTDSSEKITDVSTEITEVFEVTTEVTERKSEISTDITEETTSVSADVTELESDIVADVANKEPETITVISETITNVIEKRSNIDTEETGKEVDFSFTVSEENVQVGEKGDVGVTEERTVVVDKQDQEQCFSIAVSDENVNIVSDVTEGQDGKVHMTTEDQEITVEFDSDKFGQLQSEVTVEGVKEKTETVTESYGVETEVKTEKVDIISGEGTHIEVPDTKDVKVVDVHTEVHQQHGGLLTEDEAKEGGVHEEVSYQKTEVYTEKGADGSTKTTEVTSTITEKGSEGSSQTTEVITTTTTKTVKGKYESSEMEGTASEVLSSEVQVEQFDDSVEKEIPNGAESVLVEVKTGLSISPERQQTFSFDFVQDAQGEMESVAGASSSTVEQSFTTETFTENGTEREVTLSHDKEVIIEEYETFSIPPGQNIFVENKSQIEQLCELSEEKRKEIIDSSEREFSLLEQTPDTKLKYTTKSEQENTEYGQWDISEKLVKDGVINTDEALNEKYQQLNQKIEGKQKDHEIISASDDSLTFDNKTGVVSSSLAAAAVHEEKLDTSTKTELHQSEATGEYSNYISSDKEREKPLITDLQSDIGSKSVTESQEVEEINKQRISEISDIHKEEISRKDVEDFAESFVHKIIEEEMKEKSSSTDSSTSKLTKDLKTETGPSDGLAKDNAFEQTATIVNVEPDEELGKVAKDVDKKLKQEYTVEMPVSPDQRNLSVNENISNESQSTFKYEETKLMKDERTVHTSSPVIEEMVSPFDQSEEVHRGIVEEPDEERVVSKSSKKENVFFDTNDFELSNICQDVSKDEVKKITDTPQPPISKDFSDNQEYTKQELDSNRGVQKEETDYKSTEVREKLEFRESPSDSSSKKAAFIHHEDSCEFGFDSETASTDDAADTQFSSSKSRLMYSRRTVQSSDLDNKGYERSFDEVSGVSSTDDLEMNEDASASKFYRRRTFQRQNTDDQLEEDQCYTERPFESWSTSEHYETGRKSYKLGGNIGKEDLPSESDGVWTRKPIFSEDSLSYVSEQASISSESFRGIDTESNRTSSLERQLSEDETFFLRQTSIDSDRLNYQFPDDVNISQRQKFDPEEFFYRQISEDAAYDKQTSKERHSDQRQISEDTSYQRQSSEDAGIRKKQEVKDIEHQSSESSEPSDSQTRHLHRESEDYSVVTKKEYEADGEEEIDESHRTKHLDTAEQSVTEKSETITTTEKSVKESSQITTSTESSEHSKTTTEGGQSPEQQSSRKSKSQSPSQVVASSESTERSKKTTEGSRSPEQPSSRKSKSQSPMPQDAYQIEQLLRAARIKSPTMEEILKDRQFPPVFVKELPRLLEAKIGEDAKMTCVIRYIVKVEWKKMGKKIEKDKRRRMITDDSGNLTLHIKNVQNSDSGIYSCIATESDGTITETQCVLIVRGKKE